MYKKAMGREMKLRGQNTLSDAAKEKLNNFHNTNNTYKNEKYIKHIGSGTTQHADLVLHPGSC